MIFNLLLNVILELLSTVLMYSKKNHNSEAEPEIRKRPSTKKDNGINTHTKPEYTEDQIEHVKRLVNKPD